jgi:transposase
MPETVREDPVCRRLMTAQGLARSWRRPAAQQLTSRNASVGLAPKRYSPADRLSRQAVCGDALLRTMLYEAAQVLL